MQLIDPLKRRISEMDRTGNDTPSHLPYIFVYDVYQYHIISYHKSYIIPHISYCISCSPSLISYHITSNQHN